MSTVENTILTETITWLQISFQAQVFNNKFKRTTASTDLFPSESFSSHGEVNKRDEYSSV